jgi:hypothetical protein
METWLSNVYVEKSETCDLYYKSFTLVIYTRNVHFTIVMTVTSTIKLQS